METTSEIIKEIKQYYDKPLELNPDFAPKQEDVLKLISLYWASKFKESSQDSSGWRSAFINIVENPTLVAMKMVDFDTKDVEILAEDGQDYLPAYYMGKELTQWMKEKKIGVFLNKVISNLPKWGHCVVKKTGLDLDIVPVQNIINNPFVLSLKEHPFIEKHEYTKYQLKRMKDRGWEGVDEIVREKPDTEDGRYTILEVIRPDLKKNNFSIVHARKNGDINKTLFSGTKEYGYYEHKWDELEWRWLGRGQVEKLFENQIAENDIEKLFRQGLAWSSKVILQTRDDLIKRNLLTEHDNGDIIRAKSEITRVDLGQRSLADYNFGVSRWGQNTTLRTFATDILQGERTPAGTPLGSAVLSAQQAGTYFDFKREQIGLFLQEIIEDAVIPQFQKNANTEHIVNLLNLFDGDEIEKLDRAETIVEFNRQFVRVLGARGLPTPQEAEVMKSIIHAKITSPEGRNRKIPKDFYKDIKYKIKVRLTNEQVDSAAKVQTLSTILTLISQNPTILQDRNTKNVFLKILNTMGINPETIISKANDIPTMDNVVAQISGSAPRQPAPSMSMANMQTTRTL